MRATEDRIAFDEIVALASAIIFLAATLDPGVTRSTIEGLCNLILDKAELRADAQEDKVAA